MSTLQDNRFYRTLGAYSGAAPVPEVRSEELSAAYEQITKLTAVLTECQSYFENAADVVDGSYGQPAPNREMTLLIEIDGVLA